MNKQEIGNRLRQLRLAAGLTQADLAQRTGYAQATISGVELGASWPSLETCLAWAEACGRKVSLTFPGPRTVADTDALVEAWQDLPADERDTYLQIIQARAAKARKTT